VIATIDRPTWWLIIAMAGVLAVSSIIGIVLHFTRKSEAMRRTVANLNARIRAWWIMAGIFAGALFWGHGALCVLFGLMSFLALRELLTLTPTRPGDHHTLFWAFFVYVPLQYYLAYIRWEGFFMIFLPVFGFLFLAIRSTLTGDVTRYMERTAKVTWGVMVCVYFLSHAPGLLMLDVKGQPQSWKLLVYLVMVVQMSDVLQYVWGKPLGRHKIAPHISPGKTWEGFIGGGISAAFVGMALWKFTPFTPWGALGMAAVIVVVGFFGGIVMSAVKRDAGVKDFGHLIEGHGGMLDRVDSLTFAAPVFFHVIRWWFTGENAKHAWRWW
jgi:phosphatidate cytidylyltransferase